ncbi:hypothetical protein FOQG_11299 [Fusarium oxysporum f. sp. raphani 54005]|uniref:Uncharacterized protein n=1 Tax=Fusarium oxysporum f. sp. raphani 54005 TaxID=1089458 RepID=X0CQK2_FUSOX|nr:hypothetical protein FOQG_11299 [Fusarium oxysporum f. sp. raphani 54005]EXK84778.1 hypothetical protein FOQG_11299 [Fusarium oxysporum f. sp. raphani 54005]
MNVAPRLKLEFFLFWVWMALRMLGAAHQQGAQKQHLLLIKT